MRMEATVGGSALRLIQGDIVTMRVDAIVNAANSGLAGGGGVDGAVHRAGGPAIAAACRAIGRCPTGGAVITGAGDLPARYVIHAVAPVYDDGLSGEPGLLRSGYAASMALAEQHCLASVAFPSLGTGAYRYPVRDAARVALEAVIGQLRGETGLREVTFVLFSAADLRVYGEVLERLLPAGS